MKWRDDSPDALAQERAIAESLDRVARLRVTVSVEDRVMAGVRAHAAAHPRRAPLTGRQKTALGTAAMAAVAGEVAFWAAVAFIVLQLPGLSAVRVALGWMPDLSGACLTLLGAAVEVGQVLFGSALTIVNGVALLLPSPLVLGVFFLLAVSSLTFIAVRRDLQRSPAARGLR